MDIKETRYINLQRLIQSFDRNHIANKCGWADVNYLNQIANKHGNIGDGTARKIEKAFPDFGPEHWMDMPPAMSKVLQDTKDFSDQEFRELDVAIALILSRRRGET